MSRIMNKRQTDLPIAEREAQLLRYVDGHMDAASRGEFEQWLEQNPEFLQRARDWRADTAALRLGFEPMAQASVPERLRRAATSRHPRRWRMAAAVSWLALGTAIGYFAKPDAEPGQAAVPQLAREAAVAHAVFVPEVRHPVEVGADQEEHLVRWLSRRLGTEVKAPQLQPEGFGLVGGRLLAGDHGPVAQFMYEDRAKRRLTLYVRRGGDAGETGFRFAQEGKVGVFYWVDDKLGYALSGELDKASLLGVGESVYRQLQR